MKKLFEKIIEGILACSGFVTSPVSYTHLTEGIENVLPLSDFRFSDFDENYGVLMADGPLKGLLARSVVVIGKDGKIAYTELVPEITQEPDYDKAIEAVKK